MKVLPLLALVALVAAGCGTAHRSGRSTIPTTTGTGTVSPRPMAVTVFRVESGALRAETEQVPATQAVATAALGALGVGATVTISGGTARVALDRATPEQVAEIVYTLTQYPSVQRVDVAGRGGLTRDDVAAYVPPILVESPAAGAEVPSTFHVSGSASVFEGTLVVEVQRGGATLAKHVVTASEGAPGRGTFDTAFTAAPGDATVVAYAPSAADGSPQHEADVPITILR